MPRYKPQRQARVDWLKARHFSPKEAQEFSKLNRQYPALKMLVRQRAAQWAGFSKRAQRSGWGETRRGNEWVGFLRRFYKMERYKTRRDPKTGVIESYARTWYATKTKKGTPRKRPVPSPWEWYDAVFQRLPDEDKWDTPRSHRRRVTAPEIKIQNVQRQKWIADLDRSIRTARRLGDDDRVQELEEQKRRLQG